MSKACSKENELFKSYSNRRDYPDRKTRNSTSQHKMQLNTSGWDNNCRSRKRYTQHARCFESGHYIIPICYTYRYIHRLVIRQQSLWDSMKDIKSFNPSNDLHHFITDLNKAYIINVKPDFAKYHEMEDEFMKIAKRLLDRGIFQQTVDSQQEISKFEQLKSYLIATQCPTSNISVELETCKDEMTRSWPISPDGLKTHLEWQPSK